MTETLLDTTTISDIRTRRYPAVVREASKYLRSHGRFSISAITRYEVRRGYLWAGAWPALKAFDEFCSRSHVLPVTTEVLDRAAELWGEARAKALSPKDADLIIGATALVHELPLVTSNTRHFSWVEGLGLCDWRLG
jgi:tRNA(fMet)-specific endonuclease VapC